VHDLLVCIIKQKKGKSVGLDNIAMEAFIRRGLRLSINVCFLFNMFIKLRYLPLVLIQSVIIPLVKNKSGNLSDVNNYRAIAISTAMSKLLESVIPFHSIPFYLNQATWPIHTHIHPHTKNKNTTR